MPLAIIPSILIHKSFQRILFQVSSFCKVYLAAFSLYPCNLYWKRNADLEAIFSISKICLIYLLLRDLYNDFLLY